MGSTQGSYTLTYTDPKTKKAVMEKGKYVEVYMKQADGSWKNTADISNTDEPVAPVKK
jgi:ketosteroid isomerase-like protein